MRVRTAVCAAVLAAGAILGGAGAAVADHEIDTDVPGVVIVSPADFADDIYQHSLDAAMKVCNASVAIAAQFDPSVSTSMCSFG